MKEIINGQVVDARIIKADGGSGTLEPAERDLVAALDKALRSDKEFATAYPGAKLMRVDSNRVLKDTERGRFYLRYHYNGGDTEFWGYRGKVKLDMSKGIVAVNPKVTGGAT